MPNSVHGHGSETVTRGRGRARKVATSELQRLLDRVSRSRLPRVAPPPSAVILRTCAAVPSRRRGNQSAPLHLRRAVRLGSSASSAGRRTPMQAHAMVERQLVEKCMGEAPVFFRDQHGRDAAIVAKLKDWKTEDCSAAINPLAMSSITVFSRSTWPSTALSPSALAHSMIICISSQPSPFPLRSERRRIANSPVSWFAFAWRRRRRSSRRFRHRARRKRWRARSRSGSASPGTRG